MSNNCSKNRTHKLQHWQEDEADGSDEQLEMEEQSEDDNIETAVEGKGEKTERRGN